MGIPILQGRPIQESDDPGSRPVAVISESMARKYWPDESPIGARILFFDTLEVVGVAGDVVHRSLDAAPQETMYLSFGQEPVTRVSFVVRATGSPESLYPGLRQALWSIDADVPITRIATLDALMDESAQAERFRTLLITLYAIIATLLVAAGVFGVTARAVAQRKREMGIRRALGAGTGILLRLGITGTVLSGLAGIGGGLLGAFFVSRLIRSFLFGVQPWDPVAYSSSTIGLLAIAGLAAWLPARKAALVEPMEVLREE